MQRGTKRKASAVCTIPAKGEEHVHLYKPLDFYVYYVKQVTLKHAGHTHKLHRYVREYGFPPAAIQNETVLRFVQKYLLGKVAGRDKAKMMIIMGAYQAPDQPWCFKEILPVYLRGIAAQRKERYKTILAMGGKQRAPTNSHFANLQKVLEKRYIRGIDPELIKSGKRKGNVHGYGDVGLYHAEHQTSVMPNMSHPAGLRWKLEHWPAWLEGAVLPQIEEWPNSDDSAGIASMIQRNYAKELPHGIRTKVTIRPGKQQHIVNLFGGDESYALSALSQALLFADILRPKNPHYHRLKREHGLGAGTFTVRGYWMAFQRDRTFKTIDTRTFCPGFTGALRGAQATKLQKATGVAISVTDKGTIRWETWQTQIRFAAWLYALQQHLECARKQEPHLGKMLSQAGADPPLHCTELEATLCFSSRLVTMFENPRQSQAFYSAATAIGENLPDKVLRKLYL